MHISVAYSVLFAGLELAALAVFVVSVMSPPAAAATTAAPFKNLRREMPLVTLLFSLIFSPP
jgi:hypothetical protein